MHQETIFGMDKTGEDVSNLEAVDPLDKPASIPSSPNFGFESSLMRRLDPPSRGSKGGAIAGIGIRDGPADADLEDEGVFEYDGMGGISVFKTLAAFFLGLGAVIERRISANCNFNLLNIVPFEFSDM